MNYEDTFEKDDKINKEYTEYLKSMERKNGGLCEKQDSKNLKK